MAIQPRQTAQQQQRLLLAPNVTLALEVLRMPAMELHTFLRQQMEENPLLDVDELEEEPTDTSPDDTTNEEIPAPEPVDDWLSNWQNGVQGEREASDEGPGGRRSMEYGIAKPQSFHESLRLQLGCQQLSPEKRRVGEAVIQQLDEFGYVDGSLDELVATLRVPLQEVEAGLKLIQRLDPPGVGARDLRECLMIQLEHDQACDTLAYTILSDHFKLFIRHDLSAIAKATHHSRPEADEAYQRLKQLNPKPGRIFSGDLPPSIVPDLVITSREQHYDVELNDQSAPRVTVSRSYYRMLKNPATPPDAKEFLQNKFRKASWLIKAIDERNATLLAVGRCLITLQREFVEHGPKTLKPLTQTQVAQLIGRHASTVSRAIAGKTIDTPYGVFRLEQLFASGVPQHRTRHRLTGNDAGDDQTTASAPAKDATPTAAPEAISDARIKSEIRQFVEGENAAHPLSDEALVARLAQRNISVARRTIAKYRTSLKILPAHLRRHRS